MSGLCVVCQKNRPQWPLCCEGCRRRIRDQLTVELIDQYALLDAEPGKAEGPRISGTRTPPLPGRLDVLNLVGAGAFRVHDDEPDAAEYQIGETPTLLFLEQWVRDWRDTRNQGEHLPNATLTELVTWLDRRLDWAMDEHPAIDAFAAELAEQLATLKRVNGFKSDWRKIGHCPAEDNDQTCGTPLYANPWVDIVACRACGTRWDRQSWLFLGSVLRDVDAEEEGEGAGVNDLIEFLRARLDEDERAAKAADDDGRRWNAEEEHIDLWPEAPTDGSMTFPRKAHARHAARHDPDRVLRDVEAKRRIINRAENAQRSAAEPYGDDRPVLRGVLNNYRAVLCDLALPYADHPDYRPEWKP